MQNEHNHDHDHNHNHDHHHDHGHAHDHAHGHEHSHEAAAPATPAPEVATVAAAAPTAAAVAAPEADNSNRMIMGILAYFSILVIIPYMVAKDDAFVQFHVKQGIVLTGIWLALWVLGMTMWMLYPFIALANLGLVVLAIVGIINVVQKKEAALPLVGGLAKHIPF